MRTYAHKRHKLAKCARRPAGADSVLERFGSWRCTTARGASIAPTSRALVLQAALEHQLHLVGVGIGVGIGVCAHGRIRRARAPRSPATLEPLGALGQTPPCRLLGAPSPRWRHARAAMRPAGAQQTLVLGTCAACPCDELSRESIGQLDRINTCAHCDRWFQVGPRAAISTICCRARANSVGAPEVARPPPKAAPANGARATCALAKNQFICH